MGHKVHPIGFRLGIIRDWQARWYADAHYAEFLREDVKLRDTIKSKYREAAISLVEIERQAKDVTITLYTARPGIVIGRGGQRVDEMKHYLENLVGKRIRINIQEIRQPELDAYLVAKTIAEQIERRIAYRRAMKQSIYRTIQAGAKGIRISCAGRLGDAEIARRQTMHQGQVPLHTLRADIDYGVTEAHTTFGRIGVKVWIYKGEILPEAPIVKAEEIPDETAVNKGTETESSVEPEEKLEEPVPVAEKPDEKAPAAKPKKSKVEKLATTAEIPEKAAPSVKPEKKTKEKPVKPKAKTRTKKATPVKSEEKPEKAAPSIKPEKKTKEKPVKPKAKTRTKKATPVKSEEKPEKIPSPRRKKVTATKKPEKNVNESNTEQTTETEPSASVEKEDKDAAT